MVELRGHPQRPGSLRLRLRVLQLEKGTKQRGDGRGRQRGERSSDNGEGFAHAALNACGRGRIYLGTPFGDTLRPLVSVGRARRVSPILLRGVRWRDAVRGCPEV